MKAGPDIKTRLYQYARERPVEIVYRVAAVGLLSIIAFGHKVVVEKVVSPVRVAGSVRVRDPVRVRGEVDVGNTVKIRNVPISDIEGGAPVGVWPVEVKVVE